MGIPDNEQWELYEKFAEVLFGFSRKGKVVMKGRNKFYLNEATMKEIVDKYFDSIMLSKGKDFEVTGVKQDGDSFVVTVNEREVKE